MGGRSEARWCIYIYIHMYICICMYVCMYLSLSLSIYIYIYIYVYVCSRALCRDEASVSCVRLLLVSCSCVALFATILIHLFDFVLFIGFIVRVMSAHLFYETKLRSVRGSTWRMKNQAAVLAGDVCSHLQPRPISIPRLSLPRFADSKHPGNSPWTWAFHPFRLRFCSSILA